MAPAPSGRELKHLLFLSSSQQRVGDMETRPPLLVPPACPRRDGAWHLAAPLPAVGEVLGPPGG